MKDEAPPAPARFLRGVPWKRAEFAALDFEATGLDLTRDSVISFGVVPVSRGRIVMADSVYELVEPDVRPSPRSVKIHGLRWMDLTGARSLEEMRHVLREALAGKFLVTWSAGVEASFLDKVFGGGFRRWMRRSVDVRKLAITWDRLSGRSGVPSAYTLTRVATRLGVPVASPHHALDDALVTAELFLVLAAHLSERGYGKVRSLLAETRR